MKKGTKRLSIFRIIAFAVFIGLPVFALIASIMLPQFLTLEAYRPEILAQLQEVGGRQITIGGLRARLLPPGIAANKIVVFERDVPHRPILSADRLRLNLLVMPLLKGKLQIDRAVIDRPRLILYTDRLGKAGTFKAPGSRPNPHSSLEVLIHHGSIELDGPIFGQPIRWTIDNVEGRVNEPQRLVSLTAKPSFLGGSAFLNVMLDPNADIPVHAELKMANLDSLFSVLGDTQAAIWQGATLEAHAEASWPVLNNLVLHIDQLAVPFIPKGTMHGTFQVSASSIRGKAQFEGLISSMTVEGQWLTRRNGWDASARVERYSPEMARQWLANRWVQGLQGAGSVVVSVLRRGSQPAQFTLAGSNFSFAGTQLQIPSWSASGNGTRLDVSVNAVTRDGDGQVEVQWTQPVMGEPGNVHVMVSSVTVGDVFDVFSVRPSSPIGLEPWIIQEGTYQGLVEPDGRAIAENAALRFENLTMTTTGQIDYSTAPAQGYFVGRLDNVQLSPVLESLASRRTPISGSARADYQIRFSAGPRWLESLDGQVKFRSLDGFIPAGKVAFRIVGLFNLTNLIKSPDKTKITKAGIPYTSASANLQLTKGVLESKDLKIRTENMDIAVAGQVNLPRQTIDAKMELQLLNTVKDVISDIPLVKRIVRPDTGLIRIPVRLRGSLDNPTID